MESAPFFSSPKLQGLMEAYGESHQNPLNKLIHKFCVPAITFSLLGILKAIPGPVDLSWIFIGACLVYYAQFRDGKAMAACLGTVLPMVLILEWMRPNLFWPCVFIFVVAWIGQFYGHHLEGKKPSFLQDIFFLLIGPLWVVQDIAKSIKR